MRTKHSIKNITMSIFSQIVIVLLGFVSRKVFLDSLGVEYLGVNGLLTNVLSVLSLAESGIGISIVYNLYKPLAEDDRDKIIALIQLYKKAYGILAILTFIISLTLYPFLGTLMKNGEAISNITIIYFIFVLKTIISYLNAHKWSLINADQRGYVLAKVNLLFQVTTTIAKIVVLVVTKNFILYLIIELLLYAIQNVMNGTTVNKRYSYIKTKKKYHIDQSTKENLIKNVKAMFLQNIGGYLVFGTDNLLISSLVSLAAVGCYANYTMITQQLSALVSPILGGISASVGNLIATESTEKNYLIFKVTYFVNFWLYSCSVIFLYNLLEPFITWWFGGNYLLDHLTFIFILFNFYLDGMRTAIATFKNKAGLFVQDKYAPLIEGLINLLSSIVLVKTLGLVGIFIGTTISTFATVLWTQPCIVYKHLFKRTVWPYFAKYGLYLSLTIFSCWITSIIGQILVKGDGFLSLVMRGLVCLIVPNLLYILVFIKSQEFKYLKHIVTPIFFGLKAKLLLIKSKYFKEVQQIEVK